MGDIAPPEPALEAALDGRYVWKGSPLGTIVDVHLLLEGEELGVQNDYGHWYHCRLLKSIHGSISPDEARHISFGRRLVAREIGTLSQEERIAIYRWLKALSRDGARASQSDLPTLIRVSMGKRWIDKRWARADPDRSGQRSRNEAHGMISVIISTLNEASNLVPMLDALCAEEPMSEIIVVDGGSTDGTADIAVERGVTVIHSGP